MTRHLLTLATVTTATALLSACGLAATGDAGDGERPLVIAVDLPLQGPKKGAHEETLNALKLYLEKVGEKAGRHRVKLTVYDNATPEKGAWDADTCRRNANAHVANADEVAVIGPVNSPCSQIMIPIHNADATGPILHISHANTTTGLTIPSGLPDEPAKYYPSGKRNYGRTVTNDVVQSVANAQFAAKVLGVRKCYVLNDGSSYGKGIAKGFAAESARQGVEIIGDQTWDAKQQSYIDLFTPVRAAKPDCVFLAGIVDNNGLQLVKDKFLILGDNNAVKLVAPQGFSGSAELAAAHEAQGMYLSFAGIAQADVKGRVGAGAEFLDSYRDRYGTATTSTYVVTAVQALQIVLAAIEASDGTRRSVRDAVFEGDGVTVDEQTAIIGKAFKLDPQTGDINLREISMFKIRDQRESFDRIWVLS